MRHVQDLPAFKPACEHALVALEAGPAGLAHLIATIESDTGLTVAVLRRAQQVTSRRPIANIPEAVTKLGSEEIRAAVEEVPRASFPWRTTQEALIQDLRLHGQTVALTADRLAEEVGFEQRDDLVCAALLHDVGKLVFALAIGDVNWCADTRSTTPEQRIRDERRIATLDHACLGSVLAERWGLPEQLIGAIGGHHRSDSEASLTSLLRLADIVAHYALGDAVDHRIMLRLAAILGVRGPVLRDALFDLPHAGAGRRRAMPSPLSDRETDALRQLAAGKVYKDIALDLGVATSTVRTHLHSVYAKLEVADRAQAVLRAREMGWI
jgi:putative nucleotidyltransferase with HDIG domain